MFKDEFKAVCSSGVSKRDLLKNNPLGYFISAMLAGMFVAFGSFLTFTLGGHLAAAESTANLAKPVQSAAFAIALSLVVMAGAELFTGNNFVMTSAALRKAVSWSETIKLWGVCWLGNLLGSALAVVLFMMTKVPTGDIAAYFDKAGVMKVGLEPLPLLVRAVLGNMLVCLGVWCGIKMKSESGKLIMIFWCIFMFMVCGFEHSIANMATIGVALADGAVSLGQYLYNIVVATIGNMIGGVLFVAIPYHLISREK